MNTRSGLIKSFIIFISAALIFSFVGIHFANLGSTSASIETENAKLPIIVIDAGHGGEDGGASAYGDIPEKELNLLISNSICDALRICGIKVVMTRTEDVLLYDKDSDHQGKKKSQDLAKRLEIANSYEDAILISIHMNAFPEAKYKGLQVYFSPNNEQSYILASSIQSRTRLSLMPDNNRKVKRAGSEIYLLNRFSGTGVLIECGFLSNPEEYEKLCTDEYRKALSFVLASVILNYISNGGR